MSAVVAGIDLGASGVATAFVAGLLSFLSPCVLPLVPTYISFVAGGAGADEASGTRVRTVSRSLCFVAGFSTVFIVLGMTATALSESLNVNATVLTATGGVMLIIFGLLVSGVLHIGIANRDVRFLQRVVASRTVSYPLAFAVGAAFAAGWTPCIGPILAGILTVAATQEDVGAGAVLLTSYSLGLAVPFVAASFAIDRFITTTALFRRHLRWVNRIAGALLVVMGILLLSGEMSRISGWFARFVPPWLSV